MKKKLLTGVAGLLIGCSLTTYALAGQQIKLIVDGKTIPCNPPPQIIDGRTFVPVKFVADALGVKTIWNADKNEVLIISISPTGQQNPAKGGNQKVSYSVVDKDGNKIDIDSSPIITNDDILITLRTYGKTAGNFAGISYDVPTNIASFQYNDISYHILCKVKSGHVYMSINELKNKGLLDYKLNEQAKILTLIKS